MVHRPQIAALYTEIDKLSDEIKALRADLKEVAVAGQRYADDDLNVNRAYLRVALDRPGVREALERVKDG